MRILIDISHPAHVHFFRNTIDQLQNNGHEVIVFSRDKDITLELLDLYGLPHKVISKAPANKSIIKFGWEMLIHCYRLLVEAIKFKPDIMLQIAGTFIAPVGKVIGCPTIVFYDTEFAKLSNTIVYPLATKICTPDCYEGQIGKKQVRYAGYHELAYLHPSLFQPSEKILELYGVNREEKFFIVRFVGWGAAHDYNEKGFGNDYKIKLVRMLLEKGKVFISSEKKLPKELERYSSVIAYDHIHHLLAFSSLLVGESSTMASEAAVLGVPAIFISSTPRGYTNEQESKFGLVYNFSPESQDESLLVAEQIVSKGVEEIRAQYSKRREKMLSEKINVTSWMNKFIENIKYV